ncbi:SDR family oxidoreductase [Isoptericola sp. NEAU-Y5]|uniref:SDR family oxidoreductase n=1 Tax=Isoptericola luteus TaxID=2879484 RepID=A0ABS7ZD60_9MICO|nr:SDR family oxidoreductase [Isoptericola sp. NEAU-Y5]MCA5892976.1 SDR family oxidoreductase [Isoptericola sp. NEAU-Y5]
MKIVVVGGTGLIGNQVVALLAQAGHDAVAAAPSTGVDTLTGEGVDAALAGADVVVDVSNSPSFAPDDVLRFFTTSTRTLLDAEERAGVRHHVVLSIVGTDRNPDSGYLRAKVAQEELVRSGGVGWTVVRATQFFEFARQIADGATVDGVVRIPPVAFQPIASADVARYVAEAATGDPRRGVTEVAGPERVRFDEFVRAALADAGDDREVVADPAAPYFGAVLVEDSIVPQGDALLGAVTHADFTAPRTAV